MSKSRVFGQQIEIFFSADGATKQRLGEIDSFSYKSTPVVKKNSSLGESGVGTIDVLDDGGTLSFEAKESGAQIKAMFALMDEQHRAGGQAGKRGKTPYWEIQKVTTYYDDSTYTEIFEGTVLHDDEQSVGGRTEESSEKWQGTYKKRKGIASGGVASEDSAIAFTAVGTAISNLVNMQGATVTNNDAYKEGSAISFLSGS